MPDPSCFRLALIIAAIAAIVSPLVHAQSGTAFPQPSTLGSSSIAPRAAEDGPKAAMRAPHSEMPKTGGTAGLAGTGAQRHKHHGIAHAPKTHAAHGMVREAPLSETAAGIVHDPSGRGNDAALDIPPDRGGARAPSSGRKGGTTY